MTVRPTTSGQTARPAIGRADRSSTSATASRPAEFVAPPVTGTRGDAVQISEQARQLLQVDSGARALGGELSATRLREVIGRMNDGHYDQPAVQDQVVRLLTRDL